MFGVLIGFALGLIWGGALGILSARTNIGPTIVAGIEIQRFMTEEGLQIATLEEFEAFIKSESGED